MEYSSANSESVRAEVEDGVGNDVAIERTYNRAVGTVITIWLRTRLNLSIFTHT